MIFEMKFSFSNININILINQIFKKKRIILLQISNNYDWKNYLFQFKKIINKLDSKFNLKFKIKKTLWF